jgi:hypothetical protein
MEARAMPSLTEKDVEQKLAGVPQGTELFVSYHAGRKSTDRAVREAQKADDIGIPKRWFEGKLQRVWRTKKGQLVLCVFTYTRYNDQDPAAEGHYRTFNPSLGEVLSLEVVS